MTSRVGPMRRLLIYGLGFIALMIGASGLALILRRLLEVIAPGRTFYDSSTSTLALGLAMALVGIPVWAALWRTASRDVTADAAEASSTGRSLYLFLVRWVALGISIETATLVLLWVFRERRFSAGALAWLLVWALVWAAHQRFAARRPQRRAALGIDRAYLLAGSAGGLGVMVAGLAGLFAATLTVAYRALFGTRLGASGDAVWDRLRVPLALLMIGATVWGWHWLRRARRDRESALWRVYVSAAATAGLAAAISGAGLLLTSILQWLLGAASEPAAAHFDLIPGALTAVVLGLGGFGYHRAVVAEGAPPGTPALRPLRYLATATFLATIGSGLVTLLEVLGDALTGSGAVRSGDWWKGPIAVSIALLLIGAPGWVLVWTRVQRSARADPADRKALARRVLLTVIVAVSAVTALASATVVLYLIVRALLAGDMSRHVLFDARWALALLLTAGTIAGYHRAIRREDSRFAPPPVAAEPKGPARVIVVSSDPAGNLVRALEAATGGEVIVWRRLEPIGPPTDPGATEILLQQITALSAGAVLVIERPVGYEVVPLADG